MKIPLASSGLRNIDIEAAIEVLRSGNLTMGHQVKKFEKVMADYLKVKHFIMVNSGSSANLAIFEALLRPSKGTPKLSPGDGVLVPAVAWPTTIWPIVQLGLHPIFVDVELNTVAIDLEKAQDAFDSSTTKVRAIFPIHPLGFGIDSDSLEAFSNKNSLVLINDVCESLGSWRKGKHAGITGEASSFSFYFSHHITTMEGGGIATNNDEIADDLRAIRSHGWSRDRSDSQEWNSQISNTDAKFRFVTTGYNIRPMEIQAAIGIQQMVDLDSFIKRRRRIAKLVSDAVADTCLKVLDGSTFSEKEEDISHSWMLIPIEVRSSNPKEDKIRLLEKLAGAEIETRPVLTGNFLSQPSMSRIDGNHPPADDFPVATHITDTCFMVGAHHDLTDDQIKYLCTKLTELAKEIC